DIANTAATIRARCIFIVDLLPLPGGARRVGRARYWMISSARTRTDCGIVRPSALAVLRLITSSKFVGCSTGRSAGLAPLRILSTYRRPVSQERHSLAHKLRGSP